MKKLALSLAAVSLAFMAGAQSLNIGEGNVMYNFSSSTTGLMEYSNGGRMLTIGENVFEISEATVIKVVDETLDDNTVTVEYADTQAFVTVAGNIAPHITATVDGAHVVVNQGDGVGSATGEITYVLSGASPDGSFVFNGDYKATIELQGLTLTNPTGGVIDIQNGKRIEFSSKNGTVNTIIDGSGDQKGAIYCKGHLEFKGKGELNVIGNASHAIAAKEYVSMKNCTINVHKAAKDGISCAQYFLMESGTLNISGVDGDGIQADYKESKEADRESEDTGSITISGGELNITLNGVAAKGLKSEGNCQIDGGTVNITNNGAGEWDSAKLKTKAAACIGADGDVIFDGGTTTLTATGGGGKGVSCEGTFKASRGELNITTTGGVLAYVNGQLNQNYTGNTDRLDSDAKSSPKGIKADTEVILNGTTINIKTTGNNGEGIESKGVLYIHKGDITVRAKDDAINSSDDMYIYGGNVDVISTNNDGLDSNKSIYIFGGEVRTFGGSSPECGLDANHEEGYTVYFKGGYVLAVGGSNSLPSNEGSIQPYVTVNGQITGGNEISISNAGNKLYTFTVPEDYTKPSGGNGGWGPGGGNGGNMQILISVPGMTAGTTYTVTNGTTTSNANAQLTGSNGRPW